MSEKSKKIIKKPNPFIYYPCLFLVELFLKFKLHTTYNRSGLEGIKEPSIVVCPHVSNIDFLLVAFCVFSSGSCWIIMLITMPIFLPLAAATGASMLLTLAALMSGVGAGYTLCFYADAVFMTTASTGVANLTIIKTVMPYAVSMTVISAVFYLAMGFIL